MLRAGKGSWKELLQSTHLRESPVDVMGSSWFDLGVALENTVLFYSILGFSSKELARDFVDENKADGERVSGFLGELR